MILGETHDFAGSGYWALWSNDRTSFRSSGVCVA